jgi:hypothetical protein
MAGAPPAGKLLFERRSTPRTAVRDAGGYGNSASSGVSRCPRDQGEVPRRSPSESRRRRPAHAADRCGRVGFSDPYHPTRPPRPVRTLIEEAKSSRSPKRRVISLTCITFCPSFGSIARRPVPERARGRNCSVSIGARMERCQRNLSDVKMGAKLLDSSASIIYCNSAG